MKNCITIFIFIYLTFPLNAQYYSMYWNTPSLFNPAASGVNHKIYGAIAAKDYMIGYENSPKSFAGLFDIKVNPLHGGISMNFQHEKLGVITNNHVKLSYSYHFSFANSSLLSLGISGGIRWYNIDMDKIEFYSPDQIIDKGDKTYLFKTLDIGVMYKTPKLEIGLSSTNVNNPTAKDNSSRAYLYRNYWLTCSYQIDVNDIFIIKPNLLAMKTKNVNEITPGLLFMYDKFVWTGFSYSTNNYVSICAGIDIANVARLGYAFDFFPDGYSEKIKSQELLLAIMLN